LLFGGLFLGHFGELLIVLGDLKVDLLASFKVIPVSAIELNFAER
jgi:hypothetical protein